MNSVKIKDLNKGIKTFFISLYSSAVATNVKIKDLNKGIKTDMESKLAIWRSKKKRKNKRPE